MRRSYRLFTYDLWGNETDGFEVNNTLDSGETYDIPEGLDDEDLIALLQKEGLIKKKIDTELIEIEGDDDTIYVNYDGKPEFELRAED